MEIADKDEYEEARQRAIEAAVAALVSEYAGTLYRVAYSVLRNAADAEDAVQEAFLRVLRVWQWPRLPATNPCLQPVSGTAARLPDSRMAQRNSR